MNISTALKDGKLRDKIFTNLMLLFCIEIFLGIEFFEWRTSLNERVLCFGAAGVFMVTAIILLALGLGNKNKSLTKYGFEILVLSICAFLGHFAMAVWVAPIKIGWLSIYTLIPFIGFFVYYIIKIYRLLKNVR